MAVYDKNGNILTNVYGKNGSALSSAYDKNGNVIYSVSWENEITVQKLRNTSANTNYYVVDIPQTRSNGDKQYPFVYCPNGNNGGTMSTLTMMQISGFYFGMNGGYFDNNETGSKKPYGVTIQNSVLIRDDTLQFRNNYTLTIDDEGKLGYMDTFNSGITAQDVVNSGAVSAILGLIPLVVNGQASGVESSWWSSTERAQRQIIGQYSNGDYCIITCEGRNYDNSSGFTVTEAQNLCISMGLDFAMMVDGGGSTETVIGTEQINTIYEETQGRVVPTYIVFNGTDEFFVPNEQ